MSRMIGGDAVVETLRRAGAECFFGVISSNNMPIYDAVARTGGLKPVTPRHEQAALHMADGYSRVTGGLGVGITSMGPGAVLCLGGLYEARRSCSRVLHITGNGPRGQLGRDWAIAHGHDLPNQLEILEAVGGRATRVERTEAIPEAITSAIAQMWGQRSRPATIELPIDVQRGSAEIEFPEISYGRAPAPDRETLQRIASVLRQAQRPLIWAGGGAILAGASRQVGQLAELLDAFVVTSHDGRGVIPENSPRSLAFLTNDPDVLALLASSDVVLAVGGRLAGGDTGDAKFSKRLIHIDIDREVFGKNYPAEISLAADAATALDELLALLGPERSSHPEYAAEGRQVRDRAREKVRRAVGEHVEFADRIRATVAHDAFIVRDTNLAASTWGERILEINEPGTWVGIHNHALGPGLPLALGVKAGCPNRQVVLIMGDGGFGYHASELATAQQFGLAVVMLLFNDERFGTIYGHQGANYGGRYIAGDLQHPEFGLLAKSYGAWYRKVESTAEFGPALEAALEANQMAIVEVDMKRLEPLTFPTMGGVNWRG